MVTFETTSWTQFKQVAITAKNLSIQYNDAGTTYEIYGPDLGGILWHCSILKTDPANPDQSDFETNIIPVANGVITQQPNPFTSSVVQFAGTGFSAAFPAGKATDFYLLLSNGFMINGGEYYTIGANQGDTITVDLVDKDGVVSPAGTVLVTPSYLANWNVSPQNNIKQLFQTSYAATPPLGVYLRFTYTSTGQTDVTFYCNIFLHKSIVMTAQAALKGK
jgi:hypothetical protein